MIVINNIEIAKKRLMFSVSEDSYFFTYNIVLILGVLHCFKDRYFKDINKISLLLTIIQKPENIKVVSKILEQKKISNNDKKILFDMYYTTKLKHRSVISILFSLEKKEIISIRKKGTTLDVSLNNENIYYKLQAEKIFEDDIEVYRYIFSHVNKIKSINCNTFEEVVFKSIEGEIWDI